MGNLVLDSLEIKNFRAFRHLEIKRLGRVNLITGKNNVGKTALLEALRFYGNGGNPSVIVSMLVERDELQVSDDKAQQSVTFQILKHMFYGFDPVSALEQKLEVGPIGHPTTLKFSVGGSNVTIKTIDDILLNRHQIQSSLLIDGQPGYNSLMDQAWKDFARIAPGHIGAGNCFFIPADGLTPHDLARLWDSVALTDGEEQALQMLKVVVPEVQRFSMMGDETKLTHRIPVVKITGYDGPLPLRSLGDGLDRIFGISLALVSAKNGLLLFDEIENGLHYSVQPEIWRMIFTLAQRLNVQVFATTHSWDCIEAFQQAACENKEEEGVLIRLRRKGESIQATDFDEEDLAIITRDMIEVR